jgi:hypothetical protein
MEKEIKTYKNVEYVSIDQNKLTIKFQTKGVWHGYKYK